ncbi:PLU-1-like protein-domain-containing protein [Naematelia encephala]|uniref:PLU-1-like protein-domain-containing protein n=1 Tax=Naematelia encephala TaxID=71784 RepID=A0A1Y2AWP2_9TREE|nr:PLU-1-like protein-domain-containing protein [Naematelia encephala]
MQAKTEPEDVPLFTRATPRPRRSTPKPQTPRAQISKPQTPKSSASRPKLPSPQTSRRGKPVFTTALSYPEQLPVHSNFSVDDGNLERNQRRSKQEALTKIERGGTPLQAATGQAGTSFLPVSRPSAEPTEPAPSRNPLHRTPVVNPPFSLDTVRTEAPRHPPSRSGTRLFGLEECPTYYPTAEEFRDALGYIASISTAAKAYGICKIVPPEGWRMPFALENDTFRFKSRLQRLNSLEAASRAKINFLEQLTMFHLQQGDASVTIPVLDRKTLDVWRLRKDVNKAGGHEEVTRTQGWDKIAEGLGYADHQAANIKSAYLRIILPFDRFLIRAKSASVSPLTPMPSSTTAKPPGFQTETPASPTRPTRMSSRTSPRGNANGIELRTKSDSPQAGPSHSNGSLKPSTPDPTIRPSSAAPTLPTVKIKVPGFSTSSRADSESDLSEESLSPPPRPKSPVEYKKGDNCEVCLSGGHPEKMLLCDGCDRGFHIYCLDPPLAAVPTNEEWWCTPCMLSQGDDYGFEEGEDHSISSFQLRDAAFSYAWWNRHRPAAPSPFTPGLSRSFGKTVVNEDDVEREFWRLTESTTETVEVEYGADIHSTTHGSAGPTMETHPLDQYALDGWNLNNMPILPDSLLRYIKSDISGMTVPWLYIGMMFSTFCWHNEDHYTYSVNYEYWGETKTWYGISAADAEKFEEAMRAEAPELFEQQPGLLFQLVTMMNPGRLKELGVNVVACDQRPNEFVITFPKAYHCGFNHGINLNEAVNFALPDWLAEGKESVMRYKLHRKAPVFSHNELLVTITMFSESIKTAIWLRDSLREMVDQETDRRERLRSRVPLLMEKLIEEDVPEEQYQCCICKGFCYLSQITCECTKVVTCIDHFDDLCSCSTSKRMLRKRYSENQLEEILAVVVARANQPEAWREKLYSLLQVRRPQLKSMRALVADGERVAYPMHELRDLKRLVDRANGWIERATGLLTRKSTGRRKKGKNQEEDERSPAVVTGLLREADRLAFDSPEIQQIRQVLLNIENFRSEAQLVLSTPPDQLEYEKTRTVLILGQGLDIDMPEVAAVRLIVLRLEWIRRVGFEVDDRTMQYDDVVKLLEEAERYGIPADHSYVIELQARRDQGSAWNRKADAILEAEEIDLDQITALLAGHELTPTSLEKLRQLESVLKTAQNWQTTAKQHLAGHGSAVSAQRLCRAVKTAQGPLGRVRIPEMAHLQRELDWHTKWATELGNVINCPPNKVAASLNSIRQSFQQHFRRGDDRPNTSYACFCRQQPTAVMVTCSHCRGEYHPKCVNIAPRNADKPFRCAMCDRTGEDNRPSLNAIALFSDDSQYAFLYPPAELLILREIIDIAVRFGGLVMGICDPTDAAAPCRDADLLYHCARKLFDIPVIFDAMNTTTNVRVVFEDWLLRRAHDARVPSKPKVRGRRPRFVLRQFWKAEFMCVCDQPRREGDSAIKCTKCGQQYHPGCVHAKTEEAITEGGKSWKCPCCIVNEAKIYPEDVELRVQMTAHLGSDQYVDYRKSIKTNAIQPLIVRLDPLPSDRVIVLECTKYVEPFIPEEHDINGEDGQPNKKRRVVKATPAESDNKPNMEIEPETKATPIEPQSSSPPLLKPQPSPIPSVSRPAPVPHVSQPHSSAIPTVFQPRSTPIPSPLSKYPSQPTPTPADAYRPSATGFPPPSPLTPKSSTDTPTRPPTNGPSSLHNSNTSPFALPKMYDPSQFLREANHLARESHRTPQGMSSVYEGRLPATSSTSGLNASRTNGMPSNGINGLPSNGVNGLASNGINGMASDGINRPPIHQPPAASPTPVPSWNPEERTNLIDRDSREGVNGMA